MFNKRLSKNARIIHVYCFFFFWGGGGGVKCNEMYYGMVI